jgi:hypothetical protein
MGVADGMVEAGGGDIRIGLPAERGRRLTEEDTLSGFQAAWETRALETR